MTNQEQYELICEKAKRYDRLVEVIDKIKEEINSPNRGTCDYFIVDRIEEIIDQYRNENI